MANWVEKYDRRQVKRTANGNITGTRVFLQDDDGSYADGDLPIINVTEMIDKDDVAIPGCICNGVTESYLSGDDWDRSVFTFTFKTPEFGDGPNPSQEADDARAYTGESEILSITNPGSGWQWADGANEDVKIPIFKIIGGATFSITRSDISPAAWASFKTNKLEAQLTTINNAAFEGHRLGSVLFESYSANDYYNENGAQRFTYTLHFRVRNIVDDFSNVTQDDWNYIWDENVNPGKFRKPETKTNQDKLYKRTDFTQLI